MNNTTWPQSKSLHKTSFAGIQITRIRYPPHNALTARYNNPKIFSR